MVERVDSSVDEISFESNPDGTGVLVIAVEYGSTGWGHLEVGDVLLEIDGMPISNNGTVRYQGRFRTRWLVALGNKFIGDSLTIKVLRAGERREVKVELGAVQRLVPLNEYVRIPTYFVYGGLVFQRLNRNFLKTWRRWWHEAPTEFLHNYYAGLRTEECQEMIVLTKVLADEINMGFGKLYSESIVSVNGEPPRDMHDFVRRVEASGDATEFKTSRAGVIVLDTAEVREANQRILERYRIPRDRSPDLELPQG